MADPLLLYAIPPSLYCAKTRILLRHKGLDWQEIPPTGGYGSDCYKQIIPSGNLPALKDGDLTLSDSEAIAEYLDERYPEPPALPDDLTLRAKARERSRLHDTRLEPALRRLFAHIPKASRDKDVVDQAGTSLSFHLGVLGAHLGETELPGDQLWLCDCGFAISFEWIRALDHLMDLGVTWPARVTAYRDRINGFGPIEAELHSYRPHLTAYLDSVS